MLRVLASNPRYFTDGTGRAIYLTGSHTWSNFRDYGPTDPPAPFDSDAYLDFLVGHHHNFIRLWAWELPLSCLGQNPEPVYHAPFPWLRIGPGTASDGKPKFDLSRHDPAFFSRLRDRVTAAGERGVYVAVMLFDGYGPQFNHLPGDGFPYAGGNNVNGIDAAGVESQTLHDRAVTAVQEAYIRCVVDTVNDLDNVLYEVANEAGDYSTAWQYHIIRYVKEYEQTKSCQHPVGMTFQHKGGTDAALWESPADWISPSGAGGYGCPGDPPAADGRKVIVNDTDHSAYYLALLSAGVAAQRAWAWQNFLRGNNTLFMDPYLIPWPGRNCPDGGRPDPQWDPLRQSLGHTRLYAEKVDLAAMTPRGDLSSTAYCLASPGAARPEYLVYLPSGGTVTVDLSETGGPLAVEWFDPVMGETVESGTVIGGRPRSMTSPFAEDAVVYLRSRDG